MSLVKTIKSHMKVACTCYLQLIFTGKINLFKLPGNAFFLIFNNTKYVINIIIDTLFPYHILYQPSTNIIHWAFCLRADIGVSGCNMEKGMYYSICNGTYPCYIPVSR